MPGKEQERRRKEYVGQRYRKWKKVKRMKKRVEKVQKRRSQGVYWERRYGK